VNLSTNAKLKWPISFIASFVFAWIISYIFTNSVSLKIFDKEVDRFVLEPNTQVRMRNEGWATTNIGPHGITGLYVDEFNQKPILAIWGDSYIEGFHLKDKEKAGSVITMECRNRDDCDYTGINIGMSGQSIADYYFSIPKYEKVFQSIAMHYIVIPDMMDLEPDNKTASLSQFVSKPHYEFKKIHYQGTAYRVKSTFHALKLDFVWFLTRNLLNKEYHFLPAFGKAKVDNGTVIEQTTVDFSEAWHFLLSSLAKITDKPLTFVYCPTVPTIRNGAIDTVDPDRELAMQFEKMCKAYGFDFINLEDSFLRSWLSALLRWLAINLKKISIFLTSLLIFPSFGGAGI
jgi:hypothetical protein